MAAQRREDEERMHAGLVESTPSDVLPVRVPGATLRAAQDFQQAMDDFQMEPSAEALAATSAALAALEDDDGAPGHDEAAGRLASVYPRPLLGRWTV